MNYMDSLTGKFYGSWLIQSAKVQYHWLVLEASGSHWLVLEASKASKGLAYFSITLLHSLSLVLSVRFCCVCSSVKLNCM